jgi:hypothetical protein
LSEQKIDNLILSLTTIPDRIHEVKYAIYSILTQNILPQKIVLWLTAEQFPLREANFPQELLYFKKFGLEIHWCNEEIKSYTKLIPSLQLFHDFFIAIADDDIFYPRKWLYKLWQEHLKYPDNVICHIARKILFDKNNKVLSLRKWKMEIKSKKASFLFFQLGVGGVLYHRKYLYNDICNKDIFLNLSPYADDIWFYFMVILNNVQIRIARRPYTNLKFINPYREFSLNDRYKLSTINVGNDRNDVQFQNVLNYYNFNIFFLHNKNI